MILTYYDPLADSALRDVGGVTSYENIQKNL